LTLGAALLAQGRTMHGRETLRAAIRHALACGQAWVAAMSELLLAGSCPTTTAGPADWDAAVTLLTERRARN
jgi:hypothetical protein